MSWLTHSHYLFISSIEYFPVSNNNNQFKMYKPIYSIVFIIFLFSCSTLKQKRKIVESSLLNYTNKYPLDRQYLINEQKEGLRPFDMNTLNVLNISDSSLNRMSNKKIRTGLKTWEKNLVLIPDSVFRSALKIDSFYHNDEKISFIIKNKLKSKNIFFYEKSRYYNLK